MELGLEPMAPEKAHTFDWKWDFSIRESPESQTLYFPSGSWFQRPEFSAFDND